ncbi:hypothetical protein BH10ACI4_BH10ACI4_05810 [soil metagenome]
MREQRSNDKQYTFRLQVAYRLQGAYRYLAA